MNLKKVLKFENENRIAEINPEGTLIRAGFKEDMVLCDIGAGSGIFTFPAAHISQNTIYALEISDSMIELLESRKAERKTDNLIIKKVDTKVLPLEDGSCDMAVMVTVLHEIENKEFMLGEIKRALKKNGRLMVIEFHKKDTPMGPPARHRLSMEYVIELCGGFDFKTTDQFSLGDNFYCVVFQA